MRGAESSAPSLSWRGETFKADKNGVFTVPAEARADLERHGFVVLEKEQSK